MANKKGMAAPKNNSFWKMRAKHGRDRLFSSPEELWQAACEYFAWIEENPLYETKAFAYQGEVTTKELPKMRAFTLSGLCFYLHTNEAYFRQFKASLPEGEQGFSTVIADIEQVIFNQKFEGAAADLLNANIIARDLGLRDKKDVDFNANLENLDEAQLITIANHLFTKSTENGSSNQK